MAVNFELSRTCQIQVWLWAGTWTVQGLPRTWGQKNKDSIFIFYPKPSSSSGVAEHLGIHISVVLLKGELQEHTHLTDTMNRTVVLSISGRWGRVDIVGCFSTTRALQRHQSNVHIRLQKSTKNAYFDPAAHFLSSLMHKDATAFSVSSRGAENSEASALLYFLFCCCSSWSSSRSSRSTFKAEVNLHMQHHTVCTWKQFPQHHAGKFTVVHTQEVWYFSADKTIKN